MAAIATCARSGETPRARAYAARMGVDPEQRVPVIVQRLIAADVAGVAFTRDPRNGADDVVIEASWGLGESVVSGTVTPDVFTVGTTGSATSSLGSKESRLDLGSSGLRREPVPLDARRRSS
ncbi:MAG: pyruvate, phosphate dikinase, partial [Pseudonocardiaceae bacterium]|nr:pyruvate, phosphate dikinase [Pseudonocardiaceae bacterium]